MVEALRKEIISNMCLNTVMKKSPPRSGSGLWKVVQKSESGLYYSPMFRTRLAGIGRWTGARKKMSRMGIMSTSGQHYTEGFHMYKSIHGVKHWFPYRMPGRVVVQVDYAEGVVQGTERVRPALKVVVARRMKVVKELSVGEYMNMLKRRRIR